MVLLYLKRILLSLQIVPLLFSCNNVTETTKATTDTTKTKVTTNKALANNITELGVTVLPTVDGILDDSEVTNIVYPAKDTVDADSMNSQIAAYGTAYKVWIGPKSWTGKGESGADGNTVASLYPPTFPAVSDSTPHVSYCEIPACWGCMLSAAAPYFSGAMKEYNENFNTDGKDPLKVLEGIEIHKISSTLLTYTLPTSHHLLNCGVAYYLPAGDAGDAYYTEAHFVLPENDTILADFLVKNFIRSKQLK